MISVVYLDCFYWDIHEGKKPDERWLGKASFEIDKITGLPTAVSWDPEVNYHQRISDLLNACDPRDLREGDYFLPAWASYDDETVTIKSLDDTDEYQIERSNDELEDSELLFFEARHHLVRMISLILNRAQKRQPLFYVVRMPNNQPPEIDWELEFDWSTEIRI